MAKKQKNIIETKWLEIKAKSKVDNPNIEELDQLTCRLIADLAEMTDKGIKEIDGIDLDLYKDRVWWVVEKIGLLPEYRDEDDEDNIEYDDEEDDYYRVEEEFEIEIDDSKFYR
jgi:hypothetical protein